MSTVEDDNDASLADFVAEWDWVNTSERVTATYAVIGLTNFGERSVESTRLADVLDVPVNEAEVRARQWGWPGTRVEDGLITVNPERAKSAPRRQVHIDDRRFGVTGCAPDIFYYAPLVRPFLHLEETCPVTGTPIRIVFTPSGVDSVDPAGAVLPLAACGGERGPAWRRPATSRRSTPTSACSRPCSPPPRRRKDGWLISQAPVSSPLGRRGI